jgi:hypothetical protein
MRDQPPPPDHVTTFQQLRNLPKRKNERRQQLYYTVAPHPTTKRTLARLLHAPPRPTAPFILLAETQFSASQGRHVTSCMRARLDSDTPPILTMDQSHTCLTTTNQRHNKHTAGATASPAQTKSLKITKLRSALESPAASPPTERRQRHRCHHSHFTYLKAAPITKNGPADGGK